MIKIRTKLLLYFSMILMLVIAFSLVRGQNEQQIRDLHDEYTKHSLLFNELIQSTTETYQVLLIYVQQPIAKNLAEFENSKRKLQSTLEALPTKTGKIENYKQMFHSFIELAQNTVEHIGTNDISIYSTYLNEAEKVSSYINETTLMILNAELTDYQETIPLVEEKVKYTKRMGTMILVAMIIFSILYAHWFSNGITRTIDKLTKSAQDISKGNYQTADVIVPKKDELWFLANTFNQMKRNVDFSVKQIEEKSKLAQQLKETELRSLQNQINPHFLFNTLNVISKLSFIEGAERTSELITSVSTLLRYNIGKMDRPTTLRNEVEIVKEYFFIQKTRFGDRVEFNEWIDEDCLHVPIPCLTLQPIVENAFIHGIEEMISGAIIELNIYRQMGKVIIEVRDNGAGMSEQTIEQLLSLEEFKSENSTGIGMRNVISRLQLFNEANEVYIESTIGKGTVVTIELDVTE